MEETTRSFESSDVPKYHELMWPALQALKALGNSGSIQEIDDKTAELMQLSDDQLQVLHGDGPKTKVTYRLAWARTYLKYGGAITNTSRGIWTVTPTGSAITEEQVSQIPAKVRAKFAADRAVRGSGQQEVSSQEVSNENAIDEATDDGELEDDSVFTSTDIDIWRNTIIDTMLKLKPDQFERLCQRVLREAGFTRVRVTGRRGDGGIDGVGVLRVALLSFHVFFQCKRYKGSVGASAIRDFRGAMVGRTDKGLFITTGTFTPDAIREATRDGAPALDLIDGEALAVLLKSHQLGVSTREVEEVTIDPSWFDNL
jgi:restriction system protein